MSAEKTVCCGPCDVVLIGCGAPKRGMGWYHAKNILDGCCPSAKLTDVVEPWLLGPGRNTQYGHSFAEYAKQISLSHAVRFHNSVNKIPMSQGPRLAILCGRCADNYKFMEEVLLRGVTHILLEKPGAESAEKLKEMGNLAESKGVIVYMGYNKNVSTYAHKAIQAESKYPNAITTWIHSNSYMESQLPECFERNSEGIIKNMLVHELALLVTFYGVTASSIKSVTPDLNFTKVLTLEGPTTGDKYTDFSSIGFTVTTDMGKSVAVKGTRAGGNFSRAIVACEGIKVYQCRAPSPEEEKEIAAELKADPEIMPYFLLNHRGYVELKEKIAMQACGQGHKVMMGGLATIWVGIEALKVAEKLTEDLKDILAKQSESSQGKTATAEIESDCEKENGFPQKAAQD